MEPRRKRANFLRHVARELKLADLHVTEKRIEQLSGETLPVMTETITRGFSDIHGFLRVSGRLLAPGGLSFLMHGPKGEAVVDEVRGDLAACGLSEEDSVDFRLPFGNERRTVLSFQRRREVET